MTQKTPLFSIESIIFVLLTILSLTILFKYVDLAPHVDNDFFFSSDDPNYQADAAISRLFERKDSQLIISVTGDIFSKGYQDKIHYLTSILEDFESVTSVKSITHGPRNLEDAIKSPLWRRVLIADNQNSSNIVVIIDDSAIETLIPKIEKITTAMRSESFHIKISGFPYIVELIRKNLLIDLNVFSNLAFIVFSIAIIFVFHSWRILIGMIVSCANAGAIAFMMNQLLGIRIGVLTANLATIIFVLTLSHIIFLSFNWKHLHIDEETNHDRYSAVKEAIKQTIGASFWSMITTLLGFTSLLFVQAKPLRELGISGALGTIIAFLVAYGIYPTFLRLKKLSVEPADKQMKSFYHKTFRFFEKNYSLLVVGIMFIVLVTSPNLWKLNTDPGLLSFFNKKSEIYKGLHYIDQNGGSSPLILVVEDSNGNKLNTNKMLKRLWKLQEALEAHPDVGTVISLPTLLEEGKRAPFSFFVSPEFLLKKMQDEKYDRIAASFITKDRTKGLFLMRMKEEGRSLHRLDVIEQIKKVVRLQQFNPHLVGGIYVLQGHFSKHTADSLIYGLGRLIAAFSIIALIVSMSFRISFAMTLSISIVPLCILGVLGYFKVPLDTISAPAANIAIAMGIDAMIHMTHAYRRIATHGTHIFDDWLRVRRKMWEPIITSMFIICAGFGIFFFSSFPPTQRFGGSIVFGTVIAATSALFIFPLLAKNYHRKSQNRPTTVHK